MRSHFATSKTEGRGGRRYLPYVFTEHGVLMAANVLNTPRAIEVSVLVVRAFIKLRQMLVSHKEMAHKLAELERRLGTHDASIRSLFATIRTLMTPSTPGTKSDFIKVKGYRRWGREGNLRVDCFFQQG